MVLLESGAFSAVATTGAPIVFVGEGEQVKDLEKFESDRFISDYWEWEISKD